MLTLTRERGIFLVCLAVFLPLAFLIVQRATIYDGIRHVLFVIPMLALLAGVGLAAILPLLRRAPLAAALVGGTYAGIVSVHLARLHPLEYVAINAFAGGTREAYDKIEQDYWSAAATEGLRRLERRRRSGSAGRSPYNTALRRGAVPGGGRPARRDDAGHDRALLRRDA
jgi:hypothetical protein